MRLNAYLAHHAGLSRREADKVIASGKVMINGRVATLGSLVGENDVVRMGKATVTQSTYRYIILHKPVGYTTSRKRQNDITIYSLLPNHFHALKPAGRLDKDSSGLLILTNDGSYIFRLTHPKNAKIKRYEITLTKPLQAADIAKLKRGVKLEDGVSKLIVCNHQGTSITIELGEGRNRQIRRTFAALDHSITHLHRVSIGDISLGSLPIGKWSEIALGKLT